MVPGATGTRPQPNHVAMAQANRSTGWSTKRWGMARRLQETPRESPDSATATAVAGATLDAGTRTNTRAAVTTVVQYTIPATASSTQWWSRYTAEKAMRKKKARLAPRQSGLKLGHPSSTTMSE